MGNPKLGTPTTPETGLKCRLIEESQTAISDEWQKLTALSEYTLIVGKDADVQERDQITNITLEDGSADARTFRIERVLQRRGKALKFKSLQLELTE